MVKRIFVTFIVIGFVFLALFGFTKVTGAEPSHAESTGESVCVAFLSFGVPCPALQDLAAFIAFHMGSLKFLLAATITIKVASAFLVLAVFVIASSAGFAFAPSLVAVQRCRSQQCSGARWLLHWFSLKRHSPPL